MDTHPLDYPLMREANRLRDLADKIDSLRRDLAPRDTADTATEGTPPPTVFDQKP